MPDKSQKSKLYKLSTILELPKNSTEINKAEKSAFLFKQGEYVIFKIPINIQRVSRELEPEISTAQA